MAVMSAAVTGNVLQCSDVAHWFAFGPFGPCHCLKYLSQPNYVCETAAPERPIIRHAKPDGSKTAPVVDLIARDGRLTVSQIARALDEPKAWVKHAITVLTRAGKLRRCGKRRERDPRGYSRTVAIYGLPRVQPFPGVIHHGHKDFTS